jgi:hypothetical protein
MTEIIPGQLRQVKKSDLRINVQERGEIFFIVKEHDSMYTLVLCNEKVREWSSTFIKTFSDVIS